MYLLPVISIPSVANTAGWLDEIRHMSPVLTYDNHILLTFDNAVHTLFQSTSFFPGSLFEVRSCCIIILNYGTSLINNKLIYNLFVNMMLKN